MRKIFFFAIIIICTLSIINSIRSMYDLWQKQNLLIKTKKDVISQQADNKKLKQQLKIVSSQEFVEEEARNKLFMVAPGESTVIIPKDLLSPSPILTEGQKPLTTWEKWWHIFF